MKRTFRVRFSFIAIFINYTVSLPVIDIGGLFGVSESTSVN
jgi:hypothetical protein